MWAYIKREWWKSKEYTPQEVKMITEIHRCFRESLCGNNPPPELAMGDNKMPQLEISDQDLLPSVWNDKLQDGLLSTEVQDMISDITEYMSLRFEAEIGNSNDPWNLTCYELLVWMTRDLSGAKCNDNTLEMVNNRIQYLIKLADAKIFKPSDEKIRRTMLSVITSIRTTLQHKIKPIINREIANSCVREYLTELKKFGKTALDYGFQFLYFALRDTTKLPPADICLLPEEVTQTRTGLFLKCLAESPSYCKIFDTKAPSLTESSNRDDKPENEVTFINPFIDDNNQLCIPKSLLDNSKDPISIYQYLSGFARASVKPTGILEAFRIDNKIILDNFVEMHALLIELAKTFMVCDEAYKSAGIGGDLLVYGQSNNLINSLMDTLKKLAEFLMKCHTQIKAAINDQQAREAGNSVASLPKGTKAWLKNIQNLSSINKQFESTLSLCVDQANKIQTNSNKITAEERLEIAKKQTLYFAETAELISSHVERFLTRQPVAELTHTNSPKAASPRFFPGSPPGIRSPAEASNSEKLLIPSSRGRSSTFAMGVKPAAAEENKQTTLLSDTTTLTHSTQDPNMLDLKSTSTRVFTDNLVHCAVQLIKAKKSLTILQLKNNQLTSNRTALLWKTLADCKTLTELNCANNPLLFDLTDFSGTRMESVNSFSEFIKSTKTLTTLCLENCGIDFRIAGFLASSISINQTLEVLDLGSNPLGDEGIEAICVALQNNKKIVDLRLSYIQISDKGANHILELLKVCTQITDLMLDDRSISKEMMDKIGMQLYNNRQKLIDQQNPFINKSSADQPYTNSFN